MNKLLVILVLPCLVSCPWLVDQLLVYCREDGQLPGLLILHDDEVTLSAGNGAREVGDSKTQRLKDCRVGGTLDVTGRNTSFQAFDSFEHMSEVTIHDDSSAMADVNLLPNLQTANTVWLTRPHGSRITGFRELRSVGTLFLDLVRLDIDSFHHLEEVGWLYVGTNGQVSGFGSLTRVGTAELGTFRMTGFTSLEVVDGDLKFVGGHGVGAPVLRAVGGTLDVTQMEGTTIDLPTLERVEGILSIRNTSLTRLDGLESLRFVGGNLEVWANGGLEDVYVEGWAQHITIGGEIIICENGYLRDPSYRPCCGVDVGCPSTRRRE
ncbi:MAG: hypothetical protein HY904_19805 [Deltaproteobacteria bacterium]|nr:hypothetical protein [Deltaproteobacteria bacterium]